jgi:Na+-transporting methylmalonyl-CoA/oxaloacetate decarboxylase gamma subunit
MLAIGFLVLLILAIVIASIIIVIMRRLNRISQRAKKATANISAAASMLGSKLAPVAISTIVGYIAKRFKNARKGDN